MDYGQTNSFFTAGVGNSPAETNNFEPENNLDNENFNENAWQRSLEISAPAGLPRPEEVAAPPAPEAPTVAPEGPMPAPGESRLTPELTQSPAMEPSSSSLLKSQEQEPQLGQITTIENAIAVSPVASQVSYNPVNVKTTGDKLEKSSIAEVNSTIDKLNQTGDLNNFYDEIRSMTEVNLNNSFNRKLYGEGETH